MASISAFMHPGLVVFLGVASIPVVLFLRQKKMLSVDRGYHYIMWGVSILALGTLSDYLAEVIPGLNIGILQNFQYAGEYQTYRAVFFYLPGCILTGKGLSSWLPAIQRLSNEIALREETEKELIKAKEDADIASNSKSQFLANMSHELRTPLNAILGFSDILKNESFGEIGSPLYREYSQDIHSSGKHLLDLINDILDVAKIEAGKFQLNEVMLEVRPAIDTCTNMLSLTAKEACVAVEVEVPEHLPKLFADETRVRQIVSNLLSNSIKFTNPGGSVKVSAGLEEQGGLFISVVDTGIGIDEKDIENALSQFGQVDDRYSRNANGTGLGLPLVQLITKEHGARFEFSSKVDVGTTAIVHFPPERLRDAGNSDSAALSFGDVFAQKAG